jgi:hypothetical protein
VGLLLIEQIESRVNEWLTSYQHEEQTQYRMNTVQKIRQMAALVCIAVAVVLTGCVSHQTVARSDEDKLLQDAERYVRNLNHQGKLPGYSSKELDQVIAMAPWTGGEVSYPAPVTVQAWKAGDETMYCYELVKENPQSSWQLTKATHLDRQNKLIADLYQR